MSEPVVWLTIFVLSVFVGIEVISKVSSTLHTPLMSGANAIHGIILLGAVLVTGTTDNDLALGVGLVAIVLAAVNMVGGFVVTDRMLQMFVRKKPKKVAAGSTDNDVALVVGLVAIVLAAVNMVGGFVVTDRMLQMFVRKKPAKAVDAPEVGA